MTDWQPTCELRRYDDTDKMTNVRIQQKWVRGEEEEWRDLPLVWDKGGSSDEQAFSRAARR